MAYFCRPKPVISGLTDPIRGPVVLAPSRMLEVLCGAGLSSYNNPTISGFSHHVHISPSTSYKCRSSFSGSGCRVHRLPVQSHPSLWHHVRTESRTLQPCLALPAKLIFRISFSERLRSLHFVFAHAVTGFFALRECACHENFLSGHRFPLRDIQS